ncbi:cysteine desulfurase family protein [Agrilactobacillus fermenti]|uniref:cysteine desulfurase family protein n=1 Tax=Agrilactobacillus fermenti TaxID=2586909 RepID=UPI001E30A8F9|nr:cysteine desulfurase family protein [Agrilactobacillus fermenti]MCD2256475.1 cysteine desulfurase [Agrilactobacillus fermenti]
MIYFDNSATTKIDDSVLQTYVKVSQSFFGNPSSLHRVGEQANTILQQSRQQIADLMHVLPEEIYFTSGGTEGDNWIIKGTAMEKAPFGKHIITSQIEHPAVINSMKQLERLGFEITYLPVDHAGFVNPKTLAQAIRPDTILVSIMAVNNEIGAIQPIHEIAHVLADYPSIHFHVDAVQAIGKNLDQLLHEPRIDFLTFSGHKFHAPRGIGFVYAKKHRLLQPYMTGGGQEKDMRSGTENTPAIAAMARALRLVKTDEAKKAAAQAAIKKYLVTEISKMPNIRIFSQMNDQFAPHILCFSILGVRGETIVHAFEDKDIYISTTSACSSKKGEESSTLKAMGTPKTIAESAVRVSLDEHNTMAEARDFVAAFHEIYHHFEKLYA